PRSISGLWHIRLRTHSNSPNHNRNSRAAERQIAISKNNATPQFAINHVSPHRPPVAQRIIRNSAIKNHSPNSARKNDSTQHLGARGWGLEAMSPKIEFAIFPSPDSS